MVHCGCGKILIRIDGRNDRQSLPRLFPDWPYLHPYQRSCSVDKVTGTEVSTLQQKLNPSRKAGQRPIHNAFVVFSRSIIFAKFVIASKGIVYISTSSCCDLSSSALFLSHSASIVCPFSVSVILLYPSYQICVICWPFCLAWPPPRN